MKKLSVLIFSSIIAILVLYKVEVSKNEKVSSLLLQNIEALAADEHDRSKYCFGVGSVDCPTSYQKAEYYGIGISIEIP
ncbi:NVEALA domain-containing protein [Bacteroides reticulotermitis]|uniref:NVEALA protein n=1 Tax=Bacteroides reticulotermitis TaxID=1133319 RepID=A0A840CXF3_9BACE|nr:NVEALA domain-containing protein [Bacteroides reticulotermitis]MBB4043249.1 hypothetical protein [Bacteroides reticulotermitis]